MDESTPRFSRDFTRAIAASWTWGVALAYLIPSGLYRLPADFIAIATVTLPGLTLGPHFGEFLTGVLRGFAGVAGILATAFAVGAAATAKILPGRDRLSALFALAVGFWIMAIGTLCIGAVAVSKVPWVFCGSICWLLPQPRQFFRHGGSPAEKLDGWAKVMLVCVVVAVVLNLAGALAPPFEYDELEYHLGALADYQRIGHIAFLPHNFYSNLPQFTEMLYLLATVTSSDIAAKLLHWTFGVLSAVAVYAVAGKLWSRRVAATAAAIFYCVPFVQDLSQTARVDLATTFFATLTFGALLLDWRRWAALAAGCAVATKWPAVAVVLLPAAVFITARTKSLRQPVAFCLLSSVLVLPWLMKNWLLAGDSVYPLLSHSAHWSATQASVFAGKHYPSFDAAGLVDFVRLAWRFSGTEPRAVPLLLMLAPLVLLRRNMEASVRRAGWLFVAAYMGWWLLTFRPWRFLFPAFPIAAMVGAYAVRDRLARIAVAVVLGVALLAVALNAFVDIESPERVPPHASFLQYALGQFSHEEFVARIGNEALEPIVWMNEHLPAAAKVLYVGEARAYYARHTVVWSTGFDQFVEHATTGVTHVYVNYSELRRLHDHYGYPHGLDVEALLRSLPERARLIHQGRQGAVYELVN